MTRAAAALRSALQPTVREELKRLRVVGDIAEELHDVCGDFVERLVRYLKGQYLLLVGGGGGWGGLLHYFWQEI
jgi:hypothetical protein